MSKPWCGSDCTKGLSCLARCGGDTTCSTGCFAAFGDDTLTTFLNCALEDKVPAHQYPKLA